MKVSAEGINFYCIIYQQGYNIRSITCYFLKWKQLYCDVSPLYEGIGEFCPYRPVQMFKLPHIAREKQNFSASSLIFVYVVHLSAENVPGTAWNWVLDFPTPEC